LRFSIKAARWKRVAAPRVSKLLRAWILVVIVLGLLGTITELILLEH
jgi:hypothetical protein